VIGPQAVDLDHLVEEMTEFYGHEENREFHAIKEVQDSELLFDNLACSNWCSCRWTENHVIHIEQSVAIQLAKKLLTFLEPEGI
jgi:hypothetical protein